MNPKIQKRKNSGSKQAVYKKKDYALSIIQSILSAKNYPTRKIKISRFQNSEKTWPCWRFSNGFKRIGRGKNYTGFREKYYKLIVYYSFMIVFFYMAQ